MKKQFLVLTVLAFIAIQEIKSAQAGEEAITDHSTNAAIGFNLDSIANNFGFGLTVSSPYFFNNTSHLQLTGNVAWVQGVRAMETETSWLPYGLFKLGFFSGRMIENTPIRVYGGGGLALITPAGTLSNSGVQFGGFGLTGVELFLNQQKAKSLFLEFGAIGTGAKANQLVSSPIYANGFTIAWGYKYYL